MTFAYCPRVPEHPLRDRVRTGTEHVDGKANALFGSCPPFCVVCGLVAVSSQEVRDADEKPMSLAEIEGEPAVVLHHRQRRALVKLTSGPTESNAWVEESDYAAAMNDAERGAFEAHMREGEDIGPIGESYALATVRNILAGEFVQSAGEHDTLPGPQNERADRHVGHTRRKVDEAITRITDNNKGRWALRDCIVEHGGQIHFAPSQDLPGHADLTTIAVDWRTDDATIAWFLAQWGIAPKKKDPLDGVPFVIDNRPGAPPIELQRARARAAMLHVPGPMVFKVGEQDFTAANIDFASTPTFPAGIGHGATLPLVSAALAHHPAPVEPTFSIGVDTNVGDRITDGVWYIAHGDDEERRFKAALAVVDTGQTPVEEHPLTAVDAIRALAATRKMLASLEWADRKGRDGDAGCPLCPAYEDEKHRDGCIFITMPRPR